MKRTGRGDRAPLLGLVAYCVVVLWLSRHLGYLLSAASPHWADVEASLPAALLWASVPALLFWSGRASAWLGVAVLFLMLLFYASAGYYEGLFGRLPGVTVVHYMNEWTHMRASAGQAPLAIAMAALFAVLPLTRVPRAASGARGAARRPRTGPAGMEVPGVLAVALVAGAWAAYVQWGGTEGPDGKGRAAHDPIFWILASLDGWNPGERVDDAALAAALERYTRELGPGLPLLGDPDAPLCSGAEDRRSGNGRNVIFVVMESVSAEVPGLGTESNPLMPRLHAIARDNALRPGVVSAGGKSAQALFSYLTGQSVHPRLNLLWFPGLRVAGWPARLVERGYETTYFHGGTLVFENQRSFLNATGFSHIVELDPHEARPTSDWGWDDAYMAGRLIDWLAARGRDDEPYLAMWFTLSTHHPYTTPDSWSDPHAPLDVPGLSAEQVRAYRFLDEQLGRLFDWFDARAHRDNTILVLTGDHPADSATGEGTPYLPFIVLGLDASERAALRAAQGRLAAAHDVPATINALLDIPSGPCNRGMDVLAPERRWNADRWVYSVGGPDMSLLRVIHPDGAL
ncbi:MAG: LTA synthase family protein, partial [Gammaproteobacteria bacterium]